jgi:hypothetical protein
MNGKQKNRYVWDANSCKKISKINRPREERDTKKVYKAVGNEEKKIKR